MFGKRGFYSKAIDVLITLEIAISQQRIANKEIEGLLDRAHVIARDCGDRFELADTILKLQKILSKLSRKNHKSK